MPAGNSFMDLVERHTKVVQKLKVQNNIYFVTLFQVMH